MTSAADRLAGLCFEPHALDPGDGRPLVTVADALTVLSEIEDEHAVTWQSWKEQMRRADAAEAEMDRLRAARNQAEAEQDALAAYLKPIKAERDRLRTVVEGVLTALASEEMEPDEWSEMAGVARDIVAERDRLRTVVEDVKTEHLALRLALARAERGPTEQADRAMDDYLRTLRETQTERDRLGAVVEEMRAAFDRAVVDGEIRVAFLDADTRPVGELLDVVAERDRLRTIVEQLQRAYRRHGFSDHPDEQPAPDPEWDAALRALAQLDLGAKEDT